MRYFIRKTLLNSLDRTHTQNMFSIGVIPMLTADKIRHGCSKLEFVAFCGLGSYSLYSSRFSDVNSSFSLKQYVKVYSPNSFIRLQ